MGLENAAHILQTAQVRADARHGSVRVLFPEGCHRLVGAGLGGCRQDHGCPFPEEGFGSGKADTTAAAGNDCYFIF